MKDIKNITFHELRVKGGSGAEQRVDFILKNI